MEPPPGDVPVWPTTFSDAGDATGPLEVPLPLWPGDTGPLLLAEPSCPGATRLTLADTILRSLGSMDACGTPDSPPRCRKDCRSLRSRLRSCLPERPLLTRSRLNCRKPPVHAVYLHRYCCARAPWKNLRSCLRSRDRLNRDLPKKLLARWRNHFPLFLWNSLSLKGRSRL